MYEDPDEYLAHFPEFVRAFGGKAFEAGTAHGVNGGGGAALWLPPGVHIDDDTVAAVMEATVSPERLSALGAVLEQTAQYHPSEPHWYLPLIGVDPFRQSKKYGSALLRHALRLCDEGHMPAYLESTNPLNVSFYKRHGFETLGAVAVNSSFSFVPMLRPAR
jgi:ribosomal protein S18 acetylase RimI-like enzyme